MGKLRGHSHSQKVQMKDYEGPIGIKDESVALLFIRIECTVIPGARALGLCSLSAWKPFYIHFKNNLINYKEPFRAPSHRT
jgi:hypothetical protein